MSRSVSAPSSVTNTSPCWKGFIVPGSTLMYGSSFCMVTRSPRLLSSRPSEEAVRPFPSELATPPVTKMCFATGTHRTARPPATRWTHSPPPYPHAVTVWDPHKLADELPPTIDLSVGQRARAKIDLRKVPAG